MEARRSPLTVCIAVLCHNEERRIGACLGSLLPQSATATIHVVVNGSSDRTAEIARAVQASNLQVHEFVQGGKSRSWNRFVFDTLEHFSDIHIFADGDAEIAPGSIAALVASLVEYQHANAASALPLNGRNAAAYRADMREQRGIFGDLYAVRGEFLARMKARNIRLPDDLIGDDGLVGAMAKTNLENESYWDDTRITVCEGAGFILEPVSVMKWRTLTMQYKRMVNYSVRHFQNRIISRIMQDVGPVGLPRNLASVYKDHSDCLRERRVFPVRYFDRIALSRMAVDACRESPS